MSYSSKRGRKDRADRQRLIDRLMKKVTNGKVKLSDIITNNGTKKYVKIENSTPVVNTDKIEDDSRWDGLHGIISNSGGQKAEELLSRYRGLWQVVEAFRVNKHDLRMRPIFHWTEKRIRAHISICFIAYTLLKQALHRIKIQYKPISIDQLKNELAHAQSSILINISTKKKYCIPSHVTVNQKKIYNVFGLKRSSSSYEIIKKL